jgi:sulfate/thiosulfate transport system ATP-binding protein
VGIALENISKCFGSVKAVDCVNLEIRQGSLVAFLGASGSGKSSLLRLIAGLETPDRGRIWLGGTDATKQSVQQRNIGFVFQDDALFKHLTVSQNIGFGLEIRSISPAKVKQKVTELLDLVQLNGFEDRYPAQLSGGQRQRIALARALAIDPKVLLLDEPFGAVDTRIRKDLRAWLRHLHDYADVTTVFVTHDQDEALKIADQVVIMDQGKIERVDTPTMIYHQANYFNVLPRNLNIPQGHGIETTNPKILDPQLVVNTINVKENINRSTNQHLNTD